MTSDVRSHSLSAYDFDLPDDFIARSARPDRDGARLLVLRRATGSVEHHRVRDLPELIDDRFHVVVNDSAVAPGPDGRVAFPRYLAHLAETHPNGVPDFYDTTYARGRGSVAPPSGGLNLTPDVLDGLSAAGAGVSALTLDIGYVTFKRPESEDLRHHHMEGERYRIPPAAAVAIESARAAGRRVLAVGTSATRALEHATAEGSLPATGVRAIADNFIRPGRRLNTVSALLTGMHAPKTTLFMLVCALGGREAVMRAYDEAKRLGYRWYTLGDSMLIL